MEYLVCDARGQTSFDFVVGMAVFLVTVGFVMTFIPGVFEPFTIGSGSDELISDRAAASLTADVLAEDPADPAILNQSCTTGFFDGNSPLPECRYTSEDLQTVLGFPNSDLNVTILEPRTGNIATINGTTLAKGDNPPSAADVTTARRLVYIGDALYELRVKVW